MSNADTAALRAAFDQLEETEQALSGFDQLFSTVQDGWEDDSRPSLLGYLLRAHRAAIANLRGLALPQEAKPC